MLTSVSEPQVVEVPSSAPPAPPKVDYAIPTQAFDTSDGGATRTRRGGGLRIYLERPWYSSGDGELLGVVIGPPLTTPLVDDYRYITLLGQDPLRAGAHIAFATDETFRNALRIVDRQNALELSEFISLALYEPTYEPDTMRWFCDVDLDTGDAYMPFVRLGLVRYQEQSLPGCALSPIVTVDIVQTLPDRTLTVTRADAALELKLVGPTYTAIRLVGDPRTDDAVLAHAVARLERRNPAIADDAIGWQNIDGTEVELARSLDGVTATWTGSVQVPPDDGAARRLVVVEEDRLSVDEQTPGDDGLGARVVYADVMEL
jgi:hypothetical protein